MDLRQTTFLTKAVQAATDAKHVWPKMAACEAALESGWGTSALAIQGNNLFGEKARLHETQPTIEMLTHEWVDTIGWVREPALWVKYTDWTACFRDRLATLERLRHLYPNYDKALDAVEPQEYLFYVSLSWSTDPMRATNVDKIYQEAYGSQL